MGYAENDERLNPLTTDLYQLTMSQGFYNEGIAERETAYYLHWRTPAFPNTSYSVVAGLEEAIDFLKKFHFSDDDIAYLASEERKGQKLFTPEFLNFLRSTPLKLDVDALPEGEIQTTPGPVIKIRGALYQCQLVESALLNIINRNSIIATRASLLHDAIDGAPLAAFGLRRASEISLGSARSAYIGGCNAVADVDAGRKLGIPTSGTMAHAWVMNFQEHGKPNSETELIAFKAFLKSMPNNSILLVDTYEPKQGIRNALRAAIAMGISLDGMRLDSGNLVELAWYAHNELKKAKQTYPAIFADTKIYMTDGLDEKKILALRRELDAISLKEDNCPFPNILGYGVGTELQNPGPFRGGVYKVSAHEAASTSLSSTLKTPMELTMKVAGLNSADPTLPSSKASIPGEDLDIVRLWRNNQIVADIVLDKAQNIEPLLAGKRAISLHDNKTQIDFPSYDRYTPLLKPVFKRNANGVSEYVFKEPEKKTLYNGHQVTDLSKIRQFHIDRKEALPSSVRGVTPVEKPIVLIDPRLQQVRLDIIAKTFLESGLAEARIVSSQKSSKNIAP